MQVLPPVETERVVTKVGVPILDKPPAASGEESAEGPFDLSGPAIDVPWIALAAPPVRVADVGVALGVGAAVLLASSDVRLGVTCGVIVCLAALLRSIDRRISFSFGEGFLGYRPDPAWPRGVQEDDDVRWDWRPGRVAATTDDEAT